MSMKFTRGRIVICGLAVAVALGAVAVSLAVRNQPRDCGAEIAEAASGGTISETCQQEFQRGVQEIQDRADVLTACHDAIENKHANAWTVPLEFDSTDIETSEETSEYRVSGEAHFVTGDGSRHDRTYTCTAVARDGGPDVLSAGLR